ncbi:hypothetical protein NDA01_24345, partial [Trichocoleus desertorum AS-A10]|uniref:hypothetical protein n=1 Tax=Trichocoleus desertorum TaxID=1481672 RepID=UPI003298C7F6
DTQIGERRRQQRTSLRIWKDDQAAIASILEHFDGKLQPDKMSAWVAWSVQQLSAKAALAEEEATVDEAREAEPIEAIATTATEESADETETIQAIASTSEIADGEPEPIEESEVRKPIQSIEPINNSSLEQPIASGLESKLDKLLDVMAQFIQLQLHSQQMVSQEDSAQKAIALAQTARVAAATEIEAIPQPAIATAGTTTVPAPVTESDPTTQPAIANQDIDTAEKTNTEESKPRKYKTGEADAIVHRAIDAIMQHNNLPNQLHDLKWAITINGLKNFSTNQRVIERIMQERKDEIDAHHQLHQLLPGHNHRHKRKRKIGDVVRV